MSDEPLRTPTLLSVVAPVYDEELLVEEFVARATAAVADYEFELVLVNDGSKDSTPQLLDQIAARDPRVRVIHLSRNFGHQAALTAGLEHARGDAVAMLDADLQDPPELIPQFVRLWEQGHEVVYGVRRWREESFILRNVRKLYYRLVHETSNIAMHQGAGEFQVVDRKVVAALRQFDDYYPYVRGMVAYCGFRSVGVDYTWKSRKRGISKNNFVRLVDQALNGLISFTNVPMRLCMGAGLAIATASFVFGLFSLVVNLVYFRQLAPPGIPTLIVAVFFFSGIQLFAFGVLGEYISAIHAQVRKRPVVVERERINFEPPEATTPAAAGEQRPAI